MRNILAAGILFSLCAIGAVGLAVPDSDQTDNYSATTASLFQSLDPICHQNETNGDGQKSIDARNCLLQHSGSISTAQKIDQVLGGLSSTDRTSVLATCKIDLTKVEPKKLDTNLDKNLECVSTEIQNLTARKNGAKALADFISASINPQTAKTLTKAVANAHTIPLQPVKSTIAPAPQPAQVSVNVGNNQSAPAAGQEVGSSAYTTRSTCLLNTPGPANGSAINHPELIGVRRELLAPKEASDIYGYRLGKRYIIYQVSVTDTSKDFQYVVHDITVNLKDVLPLARYMDPSGPNETANLASSRRLDLLRGIPEKGQDLDPRNLTFHVLTGIGSVAGGVSGLTPFSDVMGSAVSVFNGAFLQALVGIAPDHTGTQLNRLSDEAFSSNALVDKLHTKDFAIFIPQDLVLKSKDHGTFWHKTRELLDRIPLDQVDVCVDGSLVTEVNITPDPTFSVTDANVPLGTSITIQDSDADAVIYDTDGDGTTPTATPAMKYAGPVTLSSLTTDDGTTKTLRAIAVSPNKQQSSVVSQTYVLRRMPTIAVTTPQGGTPTLAITASVKGDTVWYTKDGTDPATTKNAFPPATPDVLSDGATIKAIEFATVADAPKATVETFVYKAK